MSKITEVGDNNFETEVLKATVPVLVDFWAPWCGPCRQLGSTIDRIADQFAGKVKVGKLNVDDAPDVATRYGVTSIPRVFLFKGGPEPRDKVTGLTSEGDLVKMINRVMES